MKNRFIEAVADRVLLCDGAMGTMLYSKGIYINACFDELNVSHPELVRDIHREYVHAGVDLVETNTFGANRHKLKKYGLDDRVREINLAGVLIAREEAGDEILVAGSIGPLGLKIEPWGQTPVEDAEAAFREQAQALHEGGVDLFILETFSDVNEIHLAIKAVRSVSAGAVVVAEMTIGEDGNSLYGTTPEVFAGMLEDWTADVVGVNCSVGPAPMLHCIEKIARVTDLPLSAMPNAGLPQEVDGRNLYLCSPDYMAEYARRFIQAGVKLVGGCCGTTPAHIRAMRGAIRALRPPQRAAVTVASRPADRKDETKTPLRDKSGLGRKLEEGCFIKCVEIVPPRGHDPLGAVEVVRMLERSRVDCVNIPDGPRASSRMSPMALASILVAASKMEILLHYTCRDRNLLGMQSDLLGLSALNIRNLLIITGDPPKLGDYPDATAVFDVDSIGLTKVVSSLNRGMDIGGRKMGTPTSFLIGVGVNPAAVQLDHEIRRLEAKVEAGAEFAITQPIFDVRVLDNFLSRIQRLRLPVLAGIWPLWSLRNAEFLKNEVPGTAVPDEVIARMCRAQDAGPERARQEGVELACEILLAVKGMVQGIQVSPPLGKYEVVLQVLKTV
ncbi:MAG: bifunctional homocysteine S-methyltransferase/methylenetetrahydrofolate reductase [Candidatus Aminicenantes bacterium RBG_16_63_16]|nr:MAG: bifunctional homocysteine S-methyltransferase/methylenetetrahydrofolate reductase [Candidatus Aminicenantes bacterium RBG_16_63_16]